MRFRPQKNFAYLGSFAKLSVSVKPMIPWADADRKCKVFLWMSLLLDFLEKNSYVQAKLELICAYTVY